MKLKSCLPPELWTKIFAILPHIKNVRLVCQHFEKLATPFLLSGIVCAPLLSKTTTLTAVSLHPVVSTSIKELIYVCNRYRPVKTLSEYKQALAEASSSSWFYDRFTEPRSNEEKSNLKSAFTRYRQHYKDQTRIVKSGEFIARLCCALARMPSIRKVTISPNFDSVSGSWSKYDLQPEPAYDNAFLLVARVLSLTGTKLHELNIETDDSLDYEEPGVTAAPFQKPSQLNLRHSCNAFQSLRKLAIAVYGENTDGWMAGHFAEILSCAIDLEYLWIDGAYRSPISVTWFFSNSTWTQLKSVHLYNANADQTELLDFLERHSGTLKCLSFSRVCLSYGSWDIVLTWLKTSLALTNMSISDLLEENDDGEEIEVFTREEAVEDYILGDGPPPWLTRRQDLPME